jgi:hypothetical protein
VPRGWVLRAEGNQQFLIAAEPDLRPLRDWVLAKIDAGPVRFQQLQREVLPEIWRETQVNKMVSALRNEGIIEGRDYSGRFSAKANPLLARRDISKKS